jgi:hypothetical protein
MIRARHTVRDLTPSRLRARLVRAARRAACVALWAPALAAAAVSRTPARVDPKTLDRPHDPVIVRTDALGALPDRDTSRSRLYAAHDGRVEPIPFQFDQRDDDGELVLPDDGTDANFVFDADDELVFMAKDAGDRVEGGALPAGHDAALEIEVHDRAGGERAWAYLVHFPADPPARSPVKYASFDPVHQEARAASYVVSYSRDQSNYLTGKRNPGRARDDGESLIERLRMRISPTFAFLMTTYHPTFTEESFAVEPDGLKNGPVRAIRRVRQSLDLGRAFPEIPNGRVYTEYYATSFRTPSHFSIPWLALKMLRDFRFESVDVVKTDGIRYWDAANPDGVSLASSNRPAAADGDHDWWAVGSERGTLLNALFIPDEWRAWGVKRGVVFGDDGAGFTLLSMTNLRRPGAYDIGSEFVPLARLYRPGDEVDALAEIRDPLVTAVRAVGGERDGVRSAAR